MGKWVVEQLVFVGDMVIEGEMGKWVVRKLV